jgi:hypothetical protein
MTSCQASLRQRTHQSYTFRHTFAISQLLKIALRPLHRLKKGTKAYQPPIIPKRTQTNFPPSAIKTEFFSLISVQSSVSILLKVNLFHFSLLARGNFTPKEHQTP